MVLLVTTSTQFKSWKAWFQARERAISINKSNQERLFRIFDSEISNEKCRSELELHDETAFLFRQNFGPNRLGIFHHMKTLGGNIYVEKEEHGFIQGVGEESTCIVTPDFEILTRVPSEDAVPIPTATHLLAVSSIEGVDSLVNGATTTFKPRNFVPIPPFLLDTIETSISNSEGNSKQVLVDVVKALKAFDMEHADDD